MKYLLAHQSIALVTLQVNGYPSLTQCSHIALDTLSHSTFTHIPPTADLGSQ